ncbi:MAG TPA: ornithine--oxo-acid transaminase [Bacilli bacterium]|nr:ornithine--oxo-acid transaminase [Bacilli bacterium]
MNSQYFIDLEHAYGAHNYHPLDVVISHAKGPYVYDPEGRRYLDFLSAYSAVNQGHRHPKIIKALTDQAKRLTLTSRAFYNDQLGSFLKKLTEMAGFEVALPMNTGAEAVETAIKLARRYGYMRRHIEANKAEIIVASANFHGRTTTIISMSSDPSAKDYFGPYTPGFVMVPFNDADALEAAITPNTVAFLVEPIQGEAGVIIPSMGYLKKIREITAKHNVLLMLDEIQTGFGRTGKLFCYEHENIRPDVLIVGKALGGGVLPVSAVISDKKIMDVITPGVHGSTFGGNPLACAVGSAAIDVLLEEKLPQRSSELGAYFLSKLKKIKSPLIKEARGKGLLIAITLKCKARPYTEALKARGILAKETHEDTIRFAPPLIIKKSQLDFALRQIIAVLTEVK